MLPIILNLYSRKLEVKRDTEIGGVIEGDIVTIELICEEMIDARTYDVAINPESINNKNYKFDENFESTFFIISDTYSFQNIKY